MSGVRWVSLLVAGTAVLGGGLLLGVSAATPAGASSSLPPIKHVFVIIGENESQSVSFGSSSPAPYLSKTLVSEGAYIPNYYGIGHSSLDNYIAMVSGQAPNPSTSADCGTFADFPAGDGLDGSGQQTGSGCVYPANVPSLMSEADAASTPVSWRGYMQGMGTDAARDGSSTCSHPVVGSADGTEGGESSSPYDEYATRHDPFVYFHSVIDNAVPCNANVVNLSQLSGDLSSEASTSQYTFITPDLCGDGHDNPCHDPSRKGGLPGFDEFLQHVVPQITGSPAYKDNGLLIVTFDEAVGDGSSCCNEQPGPAEPKPGGAQGDGSGGGVVGAVLLSKYITPGTVSQTSYNHYGMLATVEDLFGLARTGYAVGATPFGSDVFSNPSGTTTSTTPGTTTSTTPGTTTSTTPTGPTTTTTTAVTPPPPKPLTVAQLLKALAGQPLPSGRAARIGTLLKKRSYAMALKAPEAGRELVSWYFNARKGRRLVKTLLASGARSSSGATEGTLTLHLTKAGLNALRHDRFLRIVVSAQFIPASGEAATLSRGALLLR